MNKSKKILAQFLKQAEDDSDISGSTGAVLEVALKGGPIDMNRAKGLPKKANEFTDKEHRQEKHIEESEEKSGKSPEEAEAIGYATVNKQKHADKVLNDFLKVAGDVIPFPTPGSYEDFNRLRNKHWGNEQSFMERHNYEPHEIDSARENFMNDTSHIPELANHPWAVNENKRLQDIAKNPPPEPKPITYKNMNPLPGMPHEANKKESDPCWDGYEMVGKKKKNGKEVPDCVPKKKKAEALLKQALNPGAVSFGDNIVGKKPPLPSGRVEAPANPTKAPSPEFNNYLKERYKPVVKDSPAINSTIPTVKPSAPKVSNPGETSIKDDFTASPVGQAGKVLKDYFNMGSGKHEAPKQTPQNQATPGKHEAPENHIQKFVDYLKNLIPGMAPGKHDMPVGKHEVNSPMPNPRSKTEVPAKSQFKPEEEYPLIHKYLNQQKNEMYHPQDLEPEHNSFSPEDNSFSSSKSPFNFVTPGKDSAHSTSNPATEMRQRIQQQDLQNNQNTMRRGLRLGMIVGPNVTFSKFNSGWC